MATFNIAKDGHIFVLHSLPWNNKSVTYQVTHDLVDELRGSGLENGDHISDADIPVWLREGKLYYRGFSKIMQRRRILSIDPMAPRQLVMELQSDEDWGCGHPEDAGGGVELFVCLIKESEKIQLEVHCSVCESTKPSLKKISPWVKLPLRTILPKDLNDFINIRAVPEDDPCLVYLKELWDRKTNHWFN